MKRRVARDWRCRPNRWRHERSGITHDNAVTGEVVRVIGDLVNEFVRDRCPHAAVSIRARNGATAFTQLSPDLVGALVVFGVSVIEVCCPVGNWSVRCCHD